MSTPFEIKIDAEAVQQQIVQAVINGAVGKKIAEAASNLMSLKMNPSDYRSETVVDAAIRRVMEQVITEEALRAIRTEENMARVRALVVQKLTDDTLGHMVDVVWSSTPARR